MKLFALLAVLAIFTVSCGVPYFSATQKNEETKERDQGGGISNTETIVFSGDENEVIGDEVIEDEHEHVIRTEVVKEAACSEAGRVRYYCSIDGCDYEYYESIAKTEHTPGEWVYLYGADGGYYAGQKCSVCGGTIAYKYISDEDGTGAETDNDDSDAHAVSDDSDSSKSSGKSKEPTCAEEGEILYTCERDESHTYTEAIPATRAHLRGETGHSYEWVTLKEAACTESGEKVYRCADCGDVKETETIEPTGHTESDWIVISEASCEEDSSRYKKCTVCGETLETEFIPATGHKWGELIVTRESTEDEEGEGYYECSVCGEKQTVTIDKAKPHVHDWKLTDSKDATCAEEGYETYSCEECGSTYTQSIVKRDHTPGEWEVETETTEDSAGLKVQKCTVCGETLATETIPQLEHIHHYEVSDSKDAGCTEDGYIKYTCDGCGDSYRVELKAAGHDLAVSETKEAACEEDGYILYVCRNDDTYTETVTLNALGHSYVETDRQDATCQEEGYVTYKCENCGDEYTETLEKTDHDWVQYKYRAATCGLAEKTWYRCSICREVYSEEGAPATGEHDEGTWEVTTAAQFGVEGEESRYCNTCGVKLETRSIPMLTTDGVDSIYSICVGYRNGEPVMETVIGHYDMTAAQLIAEKVNNLRATEGNNLSALSIVSSGSLQNLALVRSREIAYDFSHTRPTDSDSISQTDLNVGENIAMYGYVTSKTASETIANSLFNGWYESKGHYLNMLSTDKDGNHYDYKSMAVSVFLAKSEEYPGYYEVYGVQVFSLDKNYTTYTGDTWD